MARCKLTNETKHGSASTYNNYACRCSECKEAFRIYQIAYRKRIKDARKNLLKCL